MTLAVDGHTEFQIREADGPADMETVREMFREYQAWLGVDLCFQGFDAELAGLPGAYTAPKGVIYLAETNGRTAGIVGVRPVAGERCEMKRLYVRGPWRGDGLGRRLADLSIDFAARAGYGAMVLDTLPKLKTARALYARMGFEETAPYYENPLPGVLYMEKLL